MGLLDGLSGLFDGSSSQSGLLGGSMDPAQANAIRQALMTAGFRLMSTPGNFGSALGQAGLQGMQAYEGSLQNQRQQQMQDWQFQQQKQAAERQRAMQQLPQQFVTPAMKPEAMDNRDVGQPGEAPVAPSSFDFGGYAKALAQYDPAAAIAMQASLRKDTTPVKLGAGEKLLAPDTYRTLAENPKEQQVPEALRAIEQVYGKGSPEYIKAQRDYIAKLTTHQPGTNVTVNAAKPLVNEVAGGLGKQLDESLAGAKVAANTVQTAQQMRQLLQSGKVITGPGADTRLLLRQLGASMGVGGNDANEQLANTRTLMQGLAQSELQAAAAMKGQGQITENERKLIQRAASGDISMTQPELMALTGGLEKAARYRISQHQANVQKMSAMPEFSRVMPFYQVDMPGAMPTMTPSPNGGATPPAGAVGSGSWDIQPAGQ